MPRRATTAPPCVRWPQRPLIWPIRTRVQMMNEKNEMIFFVPVRSEGRLRHVRDLFREYADSLISFGIDLRSLIDFDKEVAELPGQYAPPHGHILLAICGTDIAGCVALRKLTDEAAELKRLYVRPPFRTQGVGRRLILAMLKEARPLGYKCVRWDSMPFMEEANRLYRSLGAKPTEPYWRNPARGAMFWELDLTS